MRADTDIRKMAKKGIGRADDTTVEMIPAMLEVQEKESEEETAFEKEMLRRFADYQQGKIVPISLDELENRVRSNHKKHTSTITAIHHEKKNENKKYRK